MRCSALQWHLKPASPSGDCFGFNRVDERHVGLGEFDGRCRKCALVKVVGESLLPDAPAGRSSFDSPDGFLQRPEGQPPSIPGLPLAELDSPNVRALFMEALPRSKTIFCFTG